MSMKVNQVTPVTKQRVKLGKLIYMASSYFISLDINAMTHSSRVISNDFVIDDSLLLNSNQYVIIASKATGNLITSYNFANTQTWQIADLDDTGSYSKLKAAEEPS